MNIIISGKNLDISEALRNQINKKVGKLERYFNPGTEAQVTLSVEKNRHIVEVTIPFNGIIIRAEESTDNMYASIDMVLDKLERQIHKYRTKLERVFGLVLLIIRWSSAGMSSAAMLTKAWKS